jgi:tRNA (guanine37-N1)-methyltransferase
VVVHIVTIFPEYFNGAINCGHLRIAQEQAFLTLNILNLRDYTDDAHRSVDDAPFGGGAGMILKPTPIFRAVESVRKPQTRIVLLSAHGRRFDQEIALELSKIEELILVCGRYKGVDERVAEHLATDEISIGDYIIAGGEAAALVILEAIVRLGDGVVGDAESVWTDSFSRGVLDAPQYTRPADFRGYQVPAVLLSGNHEAIRRWRLEQTMKLTWQRRPELLNQVTLTQEEEKILTEVRNG